MALSRWPTRVSALVIYLAATQTAYAAFMNSSSTVTSKASLPTGDSADHDKPCQFAAGSVMIWDWSAAHTAATITHTIVPHITAYPNGSSVTNNETVLATATLPNNVTASSTIVVSGFTMYDQYPLTKIYANPILISTGFIGPTPRYGPSTPVSTLATAQ